MKRVQNYIIFLFLVFLSGCFPYTYRARPYSLVHTDLCENVNEALSSDSLASGEICYERWWDFFQDPQLGRFIELSLFCHPDIKIAQARVSRACEASKIVRSTLLPHIFGGANVNRQKVSEFSPLFFGSVDYFSETTLELTSASYELDIWQKNRSLFYAAVDEIQAQIAEYEQAKLILSTTIASVYFDLQMRLEQLKVMEELLITRKELYDLLKQQFDLGIISEYRLYETDSEVQLIKDFLFVLEADIEIDKHALAALVGNVVCESEEGELLVEPSAKFNQPFPLPTSLPLDLLARRPDVTAQKWRVEASCFDIKAAKARFYPQIDLMSFVGVQSIFIGELFTKKALILLGEATGTLPIFLAGKLHAELGVAQEILEIAVETYNQTVLTAVQQVSDALTNLVSADKRKRALLKGIEDAQGLYDLTHQKYENGIVNRIAVLNAIDNVLVQKELEIKVDFERFQSAVDLIRAIGGGYYDSDCQ